MTGTLIIGSGYSLPEAFVQRLSKAIELLRSEGITVEQESSVSLEADLVVEVKGYGDISHSQVYTLLKTLFPQKDSQGVSVAIVDRHNGKRFNIPNDFEECVDWFRVE